jgi:hypothetical protein
MNKLLKIIFFLFFLSATVCTAQNLVPNPSFEQFDTCPNNQDQIRYATGWYEAFSNAPTYNGDYYNACDTIPDNFSVPYNLMEGYKPAATGNAYFGIFTYDSYYPNTAKEFIGIQLTNPLTIGKKYYVSVKFKVEINVAVQCLDCAMNHIGVLFSTVNHKHNGYFDTTGANINYAHIYADSIIKDTVNWTTVSGFFTADSAYKYILIGEFFDSVHIATLIFPGVNPCGNRHTAYYFVDDVMVTDSLTGIPNYSFQDYFNIYPNPFIATTTIKIIRSAQIKNAELKIYDAIGKQIKQQFIYEDETTIKRDNLPQGIYLLEIILNDKNFFQKLIITN